MNVTNYCYVPSLVESNEIFISFVRIIFNLSNNYNNNDKVTKIMVNIIFIYQKPEAILVEIPICFNSLYCFSIFERFCSVLNGSNLKQDNVSLKNCGNGALIITGFESNPLKWISFACRCSGILALCHAWIFRLPVCVFGTPLNPSNWSKRKGII